MKEKVKRPKEKVERTARVVAVLTFSFFLFTFAFTSSAHEPITTKVRFNKEVVRVFQQSCLGCHHTGGIAMSLATYEEARPWAKAIKEELLEKRMPPWHAVKGYGEFRNSPTLTQRDIDLIVNWVEGGAPKGEAQDLPSGPLFSNDWQLGKPDLILRSERESKIAPDADEHRILTLAGQLKEDRWLRAIDLRPGNESVVHCAIVYKLRGAVEPAPPKIHGKTEQPAVLENRPEASVLATWIPGQRTVALDEGTGELLPAGSRLAVEIHYRGSGEPSADLSAVGLYFTKLPVRSVRRLGITLADSIIPAEADRYQRKASFNIQRDSEAIAVFPQVHPLLDSVQATAYRPDGSQEVLIWTRGYQFDWRPSYSFKAPVALPKGTRIEVIAYFDNSDDNPRNPNSPAKPIRWSELTGDHLLTLLLTEANAAPAKDYNSSQPDVRVPARSP